MPHSQTTPHCAKSKSALDELTAFIEERRKAKGPVASLEKIELEANRRFAAAQAEFIGEELARFDLDVPAIMINGMMHRQVLRCEQTYMTAAGPVSVERSLYSTRGDEERAVAVMEKKAGIVEYFTPLAASHAAWVVAHLTPQEGEAMFARFGGMSPSRATLDRLPKALSSRWEDQREKFEENLRDKQKVPKKAVTVGVSLDGVLVPMKDGERQKKREDALASGKQTRGPAGYYEASVATLTFYDKVGEPLGTIRHGRMPEKGKLTLKDALSKELDAVLEQRPDLRVVKIADGPKDNWTYLAELPNGKKGEEVLDFFHAADHLHSSLAAAYGEDSPKCWADFVTYRHCLRHDFDGIEKVIRHLRYLRDKHPRRRKIATELSYFRRHRSRMHYASLARRHLPIGSGMVEASCKTLVTQRLKRSGMRWRHEGGQAILTLRALEQSGRFDAAWRLLAATYVENVTLPSKVVDIGSRRLR